MFKLRLAYRVTIKYVACISSYVNSPTRLSEFTILSHTIDFSELKFVDFEALDL